MGAFDPVNLGDAFGTGSVLHNANTLLMQKLQSQYLGQKMSEEATQAQQRNTVFDQQQQVSNTRLLNMAAAEVAQDPSSAPRWDSVLKAAIPGWSPAQGSPQQLQAGAKQLFDSTSKALAAYEASAQDRHDIPSNVREYQYYSQLNPKDQQRYLEMKRTQNPFTQVEYGGGTGILDKRAGTVNPLTSAEQEGTGKGLVAGATASASTTAQENAKRIATQIEEGYKAADGLPTINRALELLDSVKTGGVHKVALDAQNFLGVTGADEAELSYNLGKAVLGQLRSTFGAQFTAAEGERLQALDAGFGKSAEANKRILGQAKVLVERVANRGVDAAMRGQNQYDAEGIRKAMALSLSPGGSPQAQPSAAAQPSAPVQIKDDAGYDSLPSGSQFIGPDGKLRQKP